MEKNDVGAANIEIDLETALGSIEAAKVCSFKACRRVAANLSLPIGEGEINFLCSLYLWTIVMKKRGGLDAFVNWTGYNRRWKANMYKSYGKCMENELVYQHAVTRGKRILLTVKGQRVLKAYSDAIDQVRLEILAKALSGKNRAVNVIQTAA